MDTVEIKKMNTVERIQAMEMLWDALLHEEAQGGTRELSKKEWLESIMVMLNSFPSRN